MLLCLLFCGLLEFGLLVVGLLVIGFVGLFVCAFWLLLCVLICFAFGTCLF